MLELNYKTFGQGNPIIILHGLFGTLDNWQTIAKQLAEHYSVYIIDQRNHGRSPHAEPFDYPTMASDLQHFMENNWIYKAHILGHSMGGKTAMQLALDFPDMVDKLVVVDIAPKTYPSGHDAIFDALLGLDLKEIKNRKEADAALQAKIPDFGVRQFLLKNLSKNKKSGFYEWKMNLSVIYDSYQNILDNLDASDTFDGETLFIKGDKSDYIQNDDLSLLQTYFPEAKLKTVKDAGHWVHAEQPQALLEMVLAFLEG